MYLEHFGRRRGVELAELAELKEWGKKAKKHSTYHDYMKGGGKVFFFHLKIKKLIVMIYTQKKKELVPHDRKMR